ncbi:MAG: endonuclease [Coleofasciculaceae cyanobacterium]
MCQPKRDTPMKFHAQKLVNRAIKTLTLAAIITLSIIPAAVYAQSEQVLTTPANSQTSQLTLIHDIQGATHLSPLIAKKVSQVPGIVTAVTSRGFYMQEPYPDCDETTSDGILVYIGKKPEVEVADAVLVDGTVKEYFPGGTATGNLSITEIDASEETAVITVKSHNNFLPTPVVIGQGGRVPPQKVIDNDSLQAFEPTEDAIDFYESLEGMLVQVNDALVVGPTERGEITVIGDQGKNAGTLTKQGGIVISPDDFNPERIIIDDAIVRSEPKVYVGDKFTRPIVGVLDYSFGNFKLFNIEPLPEVVTAKQNKETTSLTSAANQLTIASYNVENLDPSDGNHIEQIGTSIVSNLQSPDIIGLIEIQDNNGKANDEIVEADLTYKLLIEAIEAAGGPTYQFTDIPPEKGKDGGQPGGNIRVGFLFHPERVSLVELPKGNATEAVKAVKKDTAKVELSVNPGRIDPTNSAFTRSRKPLVAEFLFNGQKVFIIANHFNSKGGDNPLFGSTQPPELKSEVKRTKQAKVVNQFVKEILSADANANVIVLGDINDFEFSTPLQVLKGKELENLIDEIPLSDRYTYNYQGNFQVLDHILVSKHLANTADPEIDIVHINAGLPKPASDHDPIVGLFKLSKVTTPKPDLPPQDTSVIFPGETGRTLLNKLAQTYAPKSLMSYADARDLLYGNIDSVDNVLKGVYTGYPISLNPDAVPRTDAFSKGINAEHVWPQSRGARSVKSDLHNIYPARMEVNGIRGNLPFAEIPDDQTVRWFRLTEDRPILPTQFIDEYSELTSGEFEPREDKEGEIARAMFYFRTIHSDLADKDFFEEQQDTLCQWNAQDPVDAVEIARSHAIATSPQGNENPFVLDATLAERTFCFIQ